MVKTPNLIPMYSNCAKAKIAQALGDKPMRLSHLGIARIAIEAEKLWQESALVLVKVEIVAHGYFLKELCLFVLDRLADEVVVGSHVKDGARGAGVAQLYHGLRAKGGQVHVRLNLEQLPEPTESQGRVRPEPELGVIVGGRLLKETIFGKVHGVDRHEILPK